MCDCQQAKPTAAPAEPKPLDLTKPVQTRDGRPARILCTDRKHSDCPIVALVTCHDYQEHSYGFCSDGRYLAGYDRDLDLVNVPPKVVAEAYANVYSSGDTGIGRSTKDKAIFERSPGAIGLIKLTAYDDGSFTVEKVED